MSNDHHIISNCEGERNVLDNKWPVNICPVPECLVNV